MIKFLSERENKIFVLLFGIMMIAFIFPINIPTTLTNSGIITLYLSQLICIAMFLVCAIKSLKKMREMNKNEKILLKSYMLIGFLYLLITIIRMFDNRETYKGFEMFFWTFSSVAFFFYSLAHLIKQKYFSQSLFFSMTVINTMSMIYHLFIIKGFKTYFLGNVNILIFFSLIGLFINFFYAKFNSPNENRKLIIYNFICCMYIIILSGSRAGFFIGIFVFLSLLLYSFYSKELFREFVVAILLTVVFAGISIGTDLYGVKTFFLRGINLSTITSSIDEVKKDNIGLEEANNSDITKPGNNDIKSAEEVLKQNDIGRFTYWKRAIEEIKLSPIIGTGRVTVGDNGLGSNQVAHNFLLEYWMIYGGLILVVWAFFIVEILKKIIKDSWKSKQYKNIYLFIIFIITVCGYSFFQPTLITGVGTILTWSIMGLFYTENDAAVK